MRSNINVQEDFPNNVKRTSKQRNGWVNTADPAVDVRQNPADLPVVR